MRSDGAWAKLEPGAPPLPLSDHGADVAEVLRRIVGEPAWAERLAVSGGRRLSEQDCERLAALAHLHDLGKTNRGFWSRQFAHMPTVGHTKETAALFYVYRLRDGPGPRRLCALIEHWGCADLFAAVMAHHGRPIEAFADDTGRAARMAIEANKLPAAHWLAGDGYDPLEALARLIDDVEACRPLTFADGPPLPDAPAFVSLVCGLLTLADWLGSDTSLFPVAGPHGAAREPVRAAGTTRAIEGRGLAALATPPCGFDAAFGFPPLGAQRVTDRTDLGAVALIEAETGSGKTEAALWRWLALRRTGVVDGLYFALPTRSAAVQLHGRVQRMLDRVFGEKVVEAVLAVPGYLRAGDAQGQALPGFAVTWPDGDIHDERWAAERPKRFLAARVAVGTIDQALMAGLKLRHAHLRLATLSRSLLVVDEVHASDAFMGEVLAGVLANHRALGGHALLLSATLTAQARERLLGSTPAAVALSQALAVPYPAISGSERSPVRVEQNRRTEKCVAMELWPAIDDAAAVAERAIAAARTGGSVLVLRNSVAGAVAVAVAVEAAAPGLAFRVSGVPTLHHGRFAPGDRRLLDDAVGEAFGRGRDARGRVLCGTQTLEQSLDIDADLLITDLAPIDVVLQRIGRLHRHERSDRGPHATARAIVLVPAERDLSAYFRRVPDRHGLGPQKDGKGVYPDLLVLEATLRLIEANPVVAIPADNRRLVEGALHPDVAEALKRQLGPDWMNHANQQAGIAIYERGLARDWALDVTRHFGELVFPDNDEAVATRLGTRDRLVLFEPPFSGPFGQGVDRLTVPGWMAGGIAAGAMPEEIVTGRDGTSFRLGERRLHYGRFGLQERNGRPGKTGTATSATHRH